MLKRIIVGIMAVALLTGAENLLAEQIGGNPGIERMEALRGQRRLHHRQNRPGKRFDEWLNRLTKAYQENDKEKVGQLIEKMHKFRQKQRERRAALREHRGEFRGRGIGGRGQGFYGRGMGRRGRDSCGRGIGRRGQGSYGRGMGRRGRGFYGRGMGRGDRGFRGSRPGGWEPERDIGHPKQDELSFDWDW